MTTDTMLTEDSVAPLILKHRAVLQRLNTDNDNLPKQPSEVGPIFDPVKVREPLSPFVQVYNDSIYGPASHFDSETKTPEKPATFTDPYLYPTLTSNEFTRLNAVWYYTRGLEHDEQMLRKLNRMLDLVKQSMGWEIGIIGLVDATVYSRLVTDNISLAIVPRRESTCSHTINTESGTVFTVTDMTKDWRFEHSPPVEVGGLRSYAGTQLRLPIGIGEDVVLGSLCVASTTVQRSLTEKQKKTLLRSSDLMMHELVMRKKMLRMKEKQAMVASLNALRIDEGNRSQEEVTLDVLRSHYPDCNVFVTHRSPQTIDLGNDVAVALTDFENGAWEDTTFLEDIVLHAGDTLPQLQRPVRALLGLIPADGRAIVVATKEIKLVFDDIDIKFIDQACQLLGSTLQARALREALAAKEKFLRTITHELRTPIHGILSSVELLSDEFKARQDSKDFTAERLAESSSSLNSFLQTIRQSGTELMTTVNNILRLNSSTYNFTSSFPTDYDLKCLEADVLGEVLANYSEDQLQAVSIRFEHQFDSPMTSVRIDADLLKELLKCLVFNAVTATPCGVIRVFTTIRDNKIVIDVEDNGCGIDPADHNRIFQPFEKIVHHSKGSGLGLSLATHMAKTLGGDLSLKTSAIGQGSKFGVVLPHVNPNSNTIIPVRQWSQDTRILPKNYHIITHSKRDLHLLEHLEYYLQLRGLRKSETAENCMIIMNQPDMLTGYDTKTIRNLSKPHFIVNVMSTTSDDASRNCLKEELAPHWTFPLTGPFFSSRLDEQLSESFASFVEHRNKTLELSNQDLDESMNRLKLAPSNTCCTTPPATPLFEEAQVVSVPEQSRSLRALLVDDNDVNLTVLKFFCKKRCIPHGTAVNGKLAVSSFCDSMAREPYSLILLDLQMPECDGVQACKQIRAYEQMHDKTPAIIFMITGQDSVTDRRSSFEAGVDDFFVKPVSLKKLERAISQYFPRPGT